MQVDQIALTLSLKLSGDAIWGHLPASAVKVGEELAAVIDHYCRQHELGYYPAIEFFRQVADIDQNLIDDAEQLAWAVSKLAREQIQVRLRPVFSNIRFRSIQTEAFALPPVRPAQSSAVEKLIKHYTPNRVRVDLQVSVLRKDDDDRSEAMEGYARKMIYRWLSDIFDEIKVTSSVVLHRRDHTGR